MKDKASRKITQTTKESAKIFAHHFFHNVFNGIKFSEFDPTILNKIPRLPTNTALEKLSSIIAMMSNNNVPGRNRIMPEAYTLWANGESLNVLANIIHKYWQDKT